MVRHSRIGVGLLAASLTVGGLTWVAPQASAGSCHYTDAPRWERTQWSGTTAGVPTELKLVWYDRQQCLESVYIAIQDSSGVTIHSGEAAISRSGETTFSTITWVPTMGTNRFIANSSSLYQFNNPGEPCYYSNCTYKNNFRYPTYTIGDFKPLAAPSAPTSVNVSANNRSLGIQWGVPTSNPGAVTEYSVVRQQTGETICKVPASQFSCTIADVPDGVYSFVVRSRNSQGAGAEAGTNPVIVGPPSAPHFDQVLRVAKGKKLRLTWMNVPATSAVPTAFRVFDDTGKEVCALPASDTAMGAEYACQVTLPPRGAAYTLKVESALGAAESEPTPRLAPRKAKGAKL